MDILLMLPGFILSLIITVVYERKLRKSRNKVHYYIARDKNGELWLYLGKPLRHRVNESWIPYHSAICDEETFEFIGLNKNDYKDLKWEDEPVEVFLNLED